MSSSVAILGGGISGLSAAYYLARLAPVSTKITLIEGKKRVGGWIESRRESSVLFEAGPRTLRPQGETGTILLEMVKRHCIRSTTIKTELFYCHRFNI